MLRRIAKSRRGQSTTEYLLIVALVAGLAMILGSQIRKRLPEVIDNVFKGVNDNISKLLK